MKRPVILSIAGFDPSSGAGITADVKTAAAQGCYAVTCITGLTVQTTTGVARVKPLPPELVTETLLALADDFSLKAVKIGMLGSAAVAEAVCDFLAKKRPPNVVLDPVLRSSSGAELLSASGIKVLRRRLLPLVDVVTPNVEEAAALTGMKPPGVAQPWRKNLPVLRQLAAELHEQGAKAVVITGGHLREANDYLSYYQGPIQVEVIFQAKRLASRSTHGTGCAFSTALACRLALEEDLEDAVAGAKAYVRRAIRSAYAVGKGTGPIRHL